MWKARLVWLSAASLLMVAYVAACVFMGRANVPLLPYLSMLGLVLAPVGVSRFIDGFWICAWLSRCRCPRGIVLALSGAFGASLAVIQDSQVLAYQSRRMRMRGFKLYLGLLAASTASLLDRVVDIEIAYEMYGLFSVYSRWRGRAVLAAEWLFAAQILALTASAASTL